MHSIHFSDYFMFIGIIIIYKIYVSKKVDFFGGFVNTEDKTVIEIQTRYLLYVLLSIIKLS